MVKHLIVFSPTSVLFFLLVCVGAEISHTVREVGRRLSAAVAVKFPGQFELH